MKLSSYISVTAVAAICWPLLDHLATELILPKIPHAILVHATAIAATVLAATFIIKGWTQLTNWLPQPWFPSPFWLAPFWLKHRPRVWIILAAPKTFVEGDILSRCSINLTLQRSLMALPFNAEINFDRAELLMTYVRHGQQKELVLRPLETGGFLSRDVSAKSYDAIMIEFTAMRLPLILADAPDFTHNYKLELRGVEAFVRSKAALRGKLPAATWHWFKADNSPQLDGGVVFQGSGGMQ